MAEKFEAWGIVELMGHARTAGRLSEQSIGGANMLRVDIPDSSDELKFRTVYYGASAIYAIHVTDENVARQVAAKCDARPTYAYGLTPLQRQLEAPLGGRTASQVDDDDGDHRWQGGDSDDELFDDAGN